MKRIPFLAMFIVATLLCGAVVISNQRTDYQLVTEKKWHNVAIENDTAFSAWANKMVQLMTLEEKIAQLMMVRVHTNFDEKYNREMVEQIATFQPGGVCFFKGGPLREIGLTNRLQAVSKIPLLVAIDGEWGVAMRLDSCPAFPRQMTLGALPEAADTLIFEMGRTIAKQCALLGIHLNFAPCIDVNNNRNNPVINSRSFGETRELVASKSIQYMKGMQAGGLLTCAKHFPGHGDTETDSHLALPIIKKSYAALDSLEFFPFKQMIGAGVDMVMVSHLNIPALDSSRAIATLSRRIITELLKEKLGFGGIVITDGMDMKGLRNSFPNGAAAEIEALRAGNDILLLPNELKIVIPAIKAAVESGEISEEVIDEKCRKVLILKAKRNLTTFTPLPTDSVIAQLNDSLTNDLIARIEACALTLLKNDNDILPLRRIDTPKIALFCIGGLQDSAELRALSQQHHLAFFQVDRDIKKGQYATILGRLKPYSKVIVAMLSTNQSIKYKYGVYDDSVHFLQALTKAKPTILALFGNPYALERFPNLEQFSAISVGYQPRVSSVKAMISAFFGDINFVGKLPVSAATFPVRSGISLSIPENLKGSGFSTLSPQTNRKIEQAVCAAIKDRIFPGCQILAVKNGKTIYRQNFGYQRFNGDDAVTDSTLFDVASMTKSLATTLAVMKLYDLEKLRLSDSVGRFLPYVRGSNKEHLTIAELMTHTSGLPAYIPFYKNISKNQSWDDQFLSKTKKTGFEIPVSDGVFLHESYLDTIHKVLINSKLQKKKYCYSDLGFIFLKEIVEAIAQQPMEAFLAAHFYEPMGLRRTLFRPLERFSKSQIAPTESDDYFRMHTVEGHVHDQTAAMFGGVSGHAGLFSTADEVAVIAQMLLAGGVWEGTRYLSEKTVKLFTSTYVLHGCRRRALGFDTPDFDHRSRTIPELSSPRTFGHQGFTGTVFWCDPEQQVVYVFLSNRVYPYAEPNRLSKSRLRVLVHEFILKD